MRADGHEPRRHAAWNLRLEALVRQGREKIDETVEFVIAQVRLPDMPVHGHAVLLRLGQRVPASQRIELHGVAQRPERPGVHVRSGFFDIAQ